MFVLSPVSTVVQPKEAAWSWLFHTERKRILDLVIALVLVHTSPTSCFPSLVELNMCPDDSGYGSLHALNSAFLIVQRCHLPNVIVQLPQLKLVHHRFQLLYYYADVHVIRSGFWFHRSGSSRPLYLRHQPRRRLIWSASTWYARPIWYHHFMWLWCKAGGQSLFLFMQRLIVKVHLAYYDGLRGSLDETCFFHHEYCCKLTALSAMFVFMDVPSRN